MGELMGEEHAWLSGRWTYEQLLAYWNRQGGPFKDPLNNIRKYVASSNAEARLQWPAAVADLKRNSNANLVIVGSGVLIGSLMAADLIDAYLLSIAPLVLGTGRRMFPEGVAPSLRLIDSATTSKGVVIATYEPARTSNRAA